MTHEEIKILISAYTDGEVTPSEKDIVEEHIKTCESCQKDLKMYKAMSSSLSKWTNQSLSPDESLKIQKGFEQRRVSMFAQMTQPRNLKALGTTLALTIIVGSVAMRTISHSVLQGRMKSAADDLGSQYSDGNTNAKVLGSSLIGDNEKKPSMNGPASYASSDYAEMRSGKQLKAFDRDGNLGSSWRQKGLMNNGAMLSANMAAAQAVSAPMMAGAGGMNSLLQEANKKENLDYAASYSGPQVNYDRKIIKNADMTLKVQSAQNTQSVLQDIVGKYNGTVNSLNMYKLEDGSRRGVMVFSVSPQSLDNVLAEVRKLGEVDSENQAGSDVTNQYSYLQARLASFEAERQRLQKTLKKSANDLENNIYIQGQISNIEENMNGLQSSLKELDKQSFMSTVTVTFYDIVQVLAPKEESLKDKTIATLNNDIKATLVTCYNLAVNSFSGIVIVLTFLFQIGLWALLFWGIYLVVRRFIK